MTARLRHFGTQYSRLKGRRRNGSSSWWICNECCIQLSPRNDLWRIDTQLHIWPPPAYVCWFTGLWQTAQIHRPQQRKGNGWVAREIGSVISYFYIFFLKYNRGDGKARLALSFRALSIRSARVLWVHCVRCVITPPGTTQQRMSCRNGNPGGILWSGSATAVNFRNAWRLVSFAKET